MPTSKVAPPARRVHRPLAPLTELLVVRGGVILRLGAAEVTPGLVGQKAFGLSAIPAVWTKPFFVISGDVAPEQNTVDDALKALGLSAATEVIVRSSGVHETVDERGSLVSGTCRPSEVVSKVGAFQNILGAENKGRVAHVHWVVQAFAAPQAKGHLSNERRLSEQLRDWVAEVEPTSASMAEAHRIAIRPWRDSRERKEEILTCPYRVNYIDRLEDVARWAYERHIRVHFEWVWDGATIYVVQADEQQVTKGGVEPRALAQLGNDAIDFAGLSLFREASHGDFEVYRKLANARLYKEIGYALPTFFVLDDQVEIQQLLKAGSCSPRLIDDLEKLTKRPLVIRTDGTDIPAENHQMLPRSDELRSVDAAREYLLRVFAQKVKASNLQDCKLCLIAHHFIPAAASAWCLAHPDQRRVRIESIWGIPEGLYWYAYDVFDVDTQFSTINTDDPMPKQLSVRERRRYKGKFVAPDENGAWVVHHTASGADWGRSVRMTEWIKEIAWTSRRIATKLGRSVVIMWFVDLPVQVSNHPVIPWYHEPWKHEGATYKAAPRKKFLSSSESTIYRKVDWETLKARIDAGERISRVTVTPTEPELVRDQHFAKELAKLAKENQFVVELAGGVLSHVYYMLTSAGCDVECVDLDDYATEDDEIKFNKLVRDKIPENIAARGEGVTVYQLDGEALIAALRRKLVEEAFEVLDAQTALQVTEELADVREVMGALMFRLQISEESVEEARKRKLKHRGGFAKRLLLSHTALASSLSVNGGADAGGRAGITPNGRNEVSIISEIKQLPSARADLHVDRRHDAKGTIERQITITLPAHSEGFKFPRATISLESPNGKPHELFLEVQLDRDQSDLRCKLRLINAPSQLELDLNPQKPVS